ncbi:MAG: winged helix-turn-helix transcriptional regulator [Oscillochloris sp.]|nr:winged helix-turn-helix transcriptional regulator [Oscillochloris sp.]
MHRHRHQARRLDQESHQILPVVCRDNGRGEPCDPHRRRGCIRHLVAALNCRGRPGTKQILKVEYSLTELGKSLEPIMLAMLDWGEAYQRANPAPSQAQT